MDEMLYNWRGALRKNTEGERIIAAQTASDFKTQGYSRVEAMDLMIANENFDITVAEAAVNEVFNYRQAAAPVAPAAIPQAVVPVGYQDVRNVVEDTLDRLSAREFVGRLAYSEAPLLRVSNRTAESFERLAARAKDDPRALEMLHTELTPWLEDAMMHSVLAAEATNGSRKALANNYDVDLEKGTCTCTKFVKAHYNDFGIACEHLVALADSVSPHQRLMRAIKK